MPTFDLDAARKAGYTDDQIAQGLAAQQGVDYAAAVKAGYAPADMLPALVRNAVATPAQSAKPGLLEDIGTGLMSAGGKVLGALDKGAVALSDVMPDWMPAKMTPEEAAQYSERGKVAQQFANEHAPERWTGQVASGLAYAPFMGAAPVVMGGAEGAARSQLLQDQGVDAATANKAGLAEGALQGVIGALPLGNFVTGAGRGVLAKSVASSVGKAAAVGAGQSVASDAATQAYLDANGYDEQARQFAPSVAKAAEGALFMGAFHGGMQGAHLVAGKVVDAAAGRLAPQEAAIPEAAPGMSAPEQLRALIPPEYAAVADAVPRSSLQAAKEASIAQARAADPVATADAVLSAPTIDEAMQAADAIINAPLPGLANLTEGTDVRSTTETGAGEAPQARAPGEPEAAPALDAATQAAIADTTGEAHDPSLAAALHAVDGMGRSNGDDLAGSAGTGGRTDAAGPVDGAGLVDPRLAAGTASGGEPDVPVADRPANSQLPLTGLERANARIAMQEQVVQQAVDNLARRKAERTAMAEPTGNPMLDNPASWIIRNKETGDVVMETADRNKVDALNTDKYEAVPAYQHLTELNDPKSLAYKVARGEAPAVAPEKVPELAPMNEENREHFDLSKSPARRLDEAAPERSDAYLRAVQEGRRRDALRILHDELGIEDKDATIDRGGAHTPSGPEDGSPLYDVSKNGTYPEDVYSHNGLRYYGTGEDRMDQQAHAIIKRHEGHPNSPVEIYRAVHKSEKGTILPGDWVTTVREYAKDHGEGALNGDYKIIKKLVMARDIFTSGDSWLEWGYHPQEFKPELPKGERKLSPLPERIAAWKARQEPEGAADDAQGEHFDRATREQAKNDALHRAVDVALRRADGLETEPIARTSAVLQLRQAFNRLESGKDADPEVAQERFRNTVEALLNRLEEKTATKQAVRDVAERQRGADFLREKLLMAKRRGDISPETADMADWFIRQNPALVDELGLSVKTFKGDGQAPAGSYNPLARVMTLFKGAANDATAVHEILHHFERLMPKDMQAAIRSEYLERIGKLLGAKDTPQPVKDYLNAALEGYASGDAKAMQRAQELLAKAPDGYYQYFNPSEFWAVNATRLMERRYGAQDSVWARMGDWLKNSVEHIKGALGLASDAPVLRALGRVLDGDSGKITRDAQMLSEGRSLHDEAERARSFYEGKTVEVDGQRRPITNAKGQLVAQDTAGQIAFWKWFGSSAVVDEQGRPLVVYHGTVQGERAQFAMNANEDSLLRGAYFSPSAKEASSYAVDDSGMRAGTVLPVYLSLKNPARPSDLSRIHENLGGAEDADATTDALIAEGFDGYIEEHGGEIVAFRAEQIKSATGNRGTFDPTKPNILYDRTKPADRGSETVDPEQDAAPPEVTTADQSALSRLVGVPKEMLHSAASSVRQMVMPITDGSMHAMAWAKDFASRGRKAEAQWRAFDRVLEKNYSKDQLEKMWLAADRENDLRRAGRTSDTEGLNSLTPDERETVELLNRYGQTLWDKAKAAGLVEGDGVAYWTPRVAARINADGSVENLRGASPGEPSKDARNLRTSASSMKQRQHDTLAESEAALKAKFGDDAAYVKNLRVMPRAMAELEKAIAGRTLVNQIKAHGQVLGEDLFSDTGDKNFVLIDHPALKRWQPKLDWLPADMDKLAAKGLEVKRDGVYKDGEQMASYRIKDGQVEQRRAVLDETGKPVMTSSPLYVRKDFSGPLKAVFTTEPNKVYRGYMELKGLSMSMIMVSPATHNMVVWGKVIPSLVSAMGWQANLKNLATGGVYSYIIGNRARADHALMGHLIEGNLVLMGGRGMNPDLPTIANGIEPGNSLLAKGLGKVGDLASKGVGDALRTGVDKFGHLWHETLLWNRVGDVQIGIALQLRKHLLDKGVDDYTATRIATHFANQYVGAIPREALSQGAHMIGNVALFSKSFTLTNLGAMKATVAGLPKEIQAQIQLHAFELNRAMGKSEVKAIDAAGNVVKQAQSIARRKAQAVLLVDMVAFTFAASALQSALQGNQFVDDLKERIGHLGVKLDADNPLSFLGPQLGKIGLPLALLRHPLDNLASLSQTSDNPHDKEDRVRLGEDPDGNTWYMRLPVGKFAEELKAYLNPSSALHLLHNKLSPVVKALVEIADNEDFNGRRVRIPTDNAFKQAASMAGHIVKAQVPFDDAVALKHVLAGDTDNQKVPLAGYQLSMDQAKLLGTATGLTVGKLAGGDVVAELRYQNREQLAKVHDVLPDVREAVRRDDMGTAQDLLEQAGQTPREIRNTLRMIEQPDRVTRSALHKFNTHADDDEQARLDKIRNR